MKKGTQLNLRRIAALLRELAAELERDLDPLPPLPPQKKRRQVKPPPPPDNVPETVKAQAAQAVRRLGWDAPKK